MSKIRVIPQKKLSNIISREKAACEKCKDLSASCETCLIKEQILTRYFNANIPVRYWKLKMSEFTGDDVLKSVYEKMTKSVEETYHEGTCICFAGSHGIGKTMCSTNILKKFLEKGYTGIYINLNDIVANLVGGNPEFKDEIRKDLLSTDLLIIDEFDMRHVSSTSNAVDLFGRVLEDIIRTRMQNKIPTILATNSPNPLDSFTGALKASLTSLMNYVEVITVLGRDFRKDGK